MGLVVALAAAERPVISAREHGFNLSALVAAHPVRTNLFHIDTEEASIRGRRAVKNFCQKDRETPCSAEKPDKCCKTCKIGTNEYKIDVNTFKDTLSRGNKKNPTDLWQYCGLPSNKVSGSWPDVKETHVGSLQFPYEEGKVQKNDPYHLPLDTEYHHGNLPNKYTHSASAGNNQLLFRKWSYRMMTGDLAQSLKDLVADWNEQDTPFNVMVTKGYEPLKEDDRRTVNPYDLYHEARQAQLVLVYKSVTACGSDCIGEDLEDPDEGCSKADQNDHTKCSRVYPRYNTPDCFKDMDGLSAEQKVTALKECKDKTIVSTNDYNYRLLADLAYKHFDHVLHAPIEETTGFTPPVDYTSVTVTARDSHRQCGATVDVVFLLDGSKSVGADGWEAQLNFVKNFAGGIKASEDTARIGVATFSGPRYSHFADHLQDVVVKVTDEVCATDDDCAHNVVEKHGMIGTREVCNTDTFRCEEHVPAHCPVGTLYEGGTTAFDGEVLSYGCVCSASSECSAGNIDRKWVPCQGDGESMRDLSDDECKAKSPPQGTERNYGCGDGYFEFETGDCGTFTDAQRAGGLFLDVGSVDTTEAFPNCETRNFFSQSCKECSCSGDDYAWEETHSSWTNFNLKDHKTAEEITNKINSQHRKTEGEIDICPQIGHGSSTNRGINHEEDDYTKWHERDDFCFNNGASHLSLGLKHILVGNKDHKGMFHPDNGARPLTDNIPRVLIVLSDGKSNPHFEPYEWSDELHANNIEVFSVGMGFRAGKPGTSTQDRSDYIKELNDMASEPIDRYRFDITGDGHLGDILQHLTDGFCERPTVLPPGGSKGPGGFSITPQIDEGQATNYKITCDRMTKKVYVVVDTIFGHTKVFVSGPPSINGVREPSEFNSGLGGASDVSKATHKVVTFPAEPENPGDAKQDSEFTELYIGVVNSDTDKAEFNIAVYLDLFEAVPDVGVRGDIVSEEGFDGIIYTPTLRTDLTCEGCSNLQLSDFEISLAETGANQPRDGGATFFEWDAAKGAIVFSAAGKARVASGLQFIIGTIELIAKHKTLGSIATDPDTGEPAPGCFDGMLQVDLKFDRTTFKVTWAKDKYEVSDLEEYAPKGTVNGRQRRIAPTEGAEVVKVEATLAPGETDLGPSSYMFKGGNDAGAFEIDNDGQVTVAKPEALDADNSRTKEFNLEVVTMNDEGLVSDTSAFVNIVLVDVVDKPYFGEIDIVTNIDAALGDQTTPGDVVLSVEIINPGALAVEELACGFEKSAGSTTEWRVTLNSDDADCKNFATNCFCDVAVGTNTKIGSAGEKTASVSIGVYYQSSQQDSKVVNMEWPAFAGDVVTESIPEPTEPAVECVDDAAGEFEVYDFVDLTCAAAAEEGYCLPHGAAKAAGNTAAAELGKVAYEQIQAAKMYAKCQKTCGICGGSKDGGKDGEVPTPKVPVSPCDAVTSTISCNSRGSCVTEGVDTPYCVCDFPYHGDGCVSKQKHVCVEQPDTCKNEGVCHPVKAIAEDEEPTPADVGSRGWLEDGFVCICPYETGVCHAGSTCSKKVECPAGGAFETCLQLGNTFGRAGPQGDAICSADPECVPSFDNEYCGAVFDAEITAEDVDKFQEENPIIEVDPAVAERNKALLALETAKEAVKIACSEPESDGCIAARSALQAAEDDLATADSSLSGKDKGSSIGLILGVLFALLLIAVLVGILYMNNKRNKDHEKTLADLRASKGQSRSASTRPKAAQSYKEGAYADVPATVNPMDNPMYGMGGMGGGDATYGDATYDQVPNGATGAYQDIPAGNTVDGASNPMYGMGNQATEGAYMDVAQPPAGDAYLDVSPDTRQAAAAVEGASNPMYGMADQAPQADTYADPTYDDATA